MLSETNVRAAFVPKELISEKSIIAFCSALLPKDTDEKIHMILHEIAHYVLGHTDEGLSDDEYYEQEKEANALAKTWLNDWENTSRS